MNAHLRPVLRIVMLTLFGACAFLLPAQEIAVQDEDDRPIEERIVYSRQSTTHIAIHSQGFGVGFKTGRIRTINRTTLWEAEVVSLHAAAGVRGQTLIVKLVNAKWEIQPVTLKFTAPLPATAISRLALSGAPDARNRPCEPSNVVPKADELPFGGGQSLALELPPCSVTVLKIAM